MSFLYHNGIRLIPVFTVMSIRPPYRFIHPDIKFYLIIRKKAIFDTEKLNSAYISPVLGTDLLPFPIEIQHYFGENDTGQIPLSLLIFCHTFLFFQHVVKSYGRNRKIWSVLKETDMMKRLISLFLVLIMLLSVLSFASAEETGFTVVTTPVLQNGEQVTSLDLRFYPDAPHVACAGMKAYAAYLPGVELVVSSDQEAGVWTVTHPNGSAVVFDPAAGTMTAADWASFQNPPVPYQGRSVGLKDMPCAWTYYSELLFDEAPQTVVFDFGKYGISFHAEADDVYLPLSLLSTMFCDVAVNYVIYNGENIIHPVIDINALAGLPAGYYESPRMQELFTGKAKREEDEIREGYAELCFVLDYFFGFPGPAPLNDAIREKGLDAALTDMGEEGAALKEALFSPDMVDYIIGMTALFCPSLDDGHTFFSGISDLIGEKSPYPDLVLRILLGSYDSLMGISGNARSVLCQQISANRNAVWGNETYRECGSTAILRVDAFNPDITGWEAYYAGTGEIPTDALGIVWTGLKRASENPEIKNVLFDLSCNLGGSGDMLMAMLDLATGDNIFRGYNVLTGQHEHAVVHTDKNLDGVFDEKDDEVRYDFNYAVLTSRASFSCGNLFPFLMQDNGAVLIGEPTGGGSCCVQMATLTGGAVFMMSSYTWQLRDENDRPIEDGCVTDLPITRVETDPETDNPRLSGGDYSAYFDDEALDRMINEWFAQQEEAPAA